MKDKLVDFIADWFVILGVLFWLGVMLFGTAILILGGISWMI